MPEANRAKGGEKLVRYIIMADKAPFKVHGVSKTNHQIVDAVCESLGFVGSNTAKAEFTPEFQEFWLAHSQRVVGLCGQYSNYPTVLRPGLVPRLRELLAQR